MPQPLQIIVKHEAKHACLRNMFISMIRRSSIAAETVHMCRMFDPEDFSIEECQKAITAAFRTRASVAQGSKMFNVSPCPLQLTVLLHAPMLECKAYA